jgi:cytochrome c-type biogenesis protein CcmH/NrfG
MSHPDSEVMQEAMPEVMHEATAQEQDLLLLANHATALASTEVPPRVQINLSRMFRDPYQLEKEERTSLIGDLRDCVELCPSSPELRVLLGMAMCVDLQAQEAMEVLREAVQMAPDNFAARLKFGELMMRLRICDQAEEHTKAASRLACNTVQAELARKQGAAIREMRRNGIERGTFKSILPRWKNLAAWRAQLTPRRGRAALELKAQ